MKLYCNRYTHFKDPLVCAVTCQYRKRCADFAVHYDQHRETINAQVLDYYAKHGNSSRQLALYNSEATPVTLRELYTLEVKQIMNDAYIWIDGDDQAAVLNYEELMERAESGAKPKHIFKVAQEMELRFQLVPRKRIEETQRKNAAEAEKATARKNKAAAPEKIAVAA